MEKIQWPDMWVGQELTNGIDWTPSLGGSDTIDTYDYAVVVGSATLQGQSASGNNTTVKVIATTPGYTALLARVTSAAGDSYYEVVEFMTTAIPSSA